MEFVDSDTLTDQEKEYFKGKLDEKLAELATEADVSVSEMKEQRLDFPDPTDRASFEFERNTELRMRDRERKLIKKIKKALQRIEDDEYNICEECGELIRKQRLDARPMTTLCISCKEVEEQQENLRDS